MYLEVIGNASKKKVEYFVHPLAERIVEALGEFSLEAEVEV